MKIKTIAIDPGISGGVCFLYEDGSLSASKMPKPLIGLYHILNAAYPANVLMEDVGFHIKGNSAMASVTFGAHCAVIKAYCEIADNPLTLVSPKTWINPLAVQKGGDPKSKRLRKNQIKDKMALRYPYIPKITLSTSDAIGIMDWYINNNYLAIFLDEEGAK